MANRDEGIKNSWVFGQEQYFCAMTTYQRPILQLMVTALTLLLAQTIWPTHFDVTPTWMALVVALLLAVLNVIVKPILVILTIPATLITLGLFLLVINASIILIAREILEPHFMVSSFWWALWLSLFISIANAIIGGNVKVEKIDDHS